MQLRKKLTPEVVVSADYLPNGIALRVRKTGDQYDNAVAIVEVVDGKPQLVLFQDTPVHAGLAVRKENVNPQEW